ncbi:MAG: NosD domain-containing protein [Candidatus Thorarchaeota archaeon]
MLRSSRTSLFFLLILVASLLFIQQVDPVSDQTLTIEYETPNLIPVLSEYTPHSPIEIWSNQDFKDQGWPGNGTADDPYVIDGLNITTDERGIAIFDTTVYYQITNCMISSLGSRSFAGIRLQNASHGSVSNCIIDTHKEGVHVIGSNYCNVTNTIAFNNLWSGIYFQGSDYGLAKNNTCFDNSGGVTVNYCEYCVISDNNATLNRAGITIDSGLYHYAYNNTSWRNSGRGFQVSFSEFCTIQQNYVFRSGTVGFFIDYIEDCTFIENTVLNSTERGFYIEDTTYCEFQSNLGANNTWEGFWLYDSDSNTFIENIATQNSGAGIGMNIFCSGNRMYLNELSLNIINNGQDYSGANYWDDGVSVGNYWDDYNGRGSYAVGGSGGAYDNYPFSLGIIPYLEHPEDIVFEYGTSGNGIIWDAHDVDPSTYELYVDEVFQVSDAWNGSPIVIDIDGLEISYYNYTVVVADDLGHSAIDTVFVTVQDTISPTVDSPADIEFEEGATGYSITWVIDDLDPGTYTIYRNEVPIINEVWDTSQISISLNGLSAGIYNFTLVLFDGSDNTAVDIVIVTVTEIAPTTSTTTSTTSTTTTSTSPTTTDSTSITSTDLPSTTPTSPGEVDSQMILLIAGLGGVIGLVVVIVAIVFRKGKT